MLFAQVESFTGCVMNRYKNAPAASVVDRTAGAQNQNLCLGKSKPCLRLVEKVNLPLRFALSYFFLSGLLLGCFFTTFFLAAFFFTLFSSQLF